MHFIKISDFSVYVQVWHNTWEHHPVWAEHRHCAHHRPGCSLWMCRCHPTLTAHVRAKGGLPWHTEDVLLWCLPQVSLKHTASDIQSTAKVTRTVNNCILSPVVTVGGQTKMQHAYLKYAVLRLAPFNLKSRGYLIFVSLGTFTFSSVIFYLLCYASPPPQSFNDFEATAFAVLVVCS